MWGAGKTITPTACGNVTVYCPLSSSQPTAVSTGYYTGGSASNATNSWQQPCPPGFYCQAGVQYGCLPGTFRNADKGTSAGDCSACMSGFYCPAASTHPISCGGNEYFCLAGSAQPTHVSPGHYSTGLPGARSGETNCTSGSYCPGDGNLYPCLAGTFGNTTGLDTGNCSGRCYDGAPLVPPCACSCMRCARVGV